MQLRDLISTEYGEKTTNKPNVVILNDINILRGFLASFCRNMNEKQVYGPFPILRTFHVINSLLGSRPRFFEKYGSTKADPSPATAGSG